MQLRKYILRYNESFNIHIQSLEGVGIDRRARKAGTLRGPMAHYALKESFIRMDVYRTPSLLKNAFKAYLVTRSKHTKVRMTLIEDHVKMDLHMHR